MENVTSKAADNHAQDPIISITNQELKEQGSDSNNWGSINDSTLLRAIDGPETATHVTMVDTDKDTDEDTDEDDGVDQDIKMDDVHIPILNPTKTPIPILGTVPSTVTVPVQSITTDWGSMNDSQFISLVNKISQSRANATLDGNAGGESIANQTTNVDVYGAGELGNSSPQLLINTSKLVSERLDIDDTRDINSHNLLSSPLLLAQNVVDLSSHSDTIEGTTKEDLEDADKFAFDDYEGYFQAKKQKQDIQGEQLSKFLKQNNSSTDDYPPIFANCAIHVNGRTDPDILQLRKMIVLFGGKYVHFLSNKSSATHIVAESLPPRKRIKYGNCKVVSPKWIVDSIREKNLLPWSDYRLKQLAEYGQQPIPFARASDIPKVEASPIPEDQELPVIENAVLKEGNKTEAIAVADADFENGIESEYVEDVDISGEDDLRNEVMSQELKSAGVDANHPNFLKVFFSKSRLHHLSTWKSELRSNFLNKAINILKAKDSEMSTSKERVILHVDFDCFFATVSAQLHVPPIDINSVPCCVTHGGGSADVSSCNYIARDYGVKNGMWMSQAKKLCPNIIALPYQFDEYEIRSKMFYDTLLSMDIDSILPVSVDEALLDITTMCETDDSNIFDVVKNVKDQLDTLTCCTVSCGVGKNVLLAKLALREAKPDGVFVVPQGESEMMNFLDTVDVKQLPGMGRKLFTKFESLLPGKSDITLAALRAVGKMVLINTFGNKMGEKLYEYSRGIDNTSIDILGEPEKFLRKSISIDINWGIRFEKDSQVESFLFQLSKELNKRLLDAGMVGTFLTLKLAIRHPDSPVEPAKYMGMGKCTFLTKSARLGVCTREIGVISMELKFLLRFLNINAKELRGIGISMTKLVPDDQAAAQYTNQMRLPFKFEGKKKATILKDVPEVEHIIYQEKPTMKVKRDDIFNVRSPERKAPVNRGAIHQIESQEIDWEVFDNLPPNLQMEIKNELRRRRLRASPKKQKPLTNGRDITTLLSPQKKTPNPSRFHQMDVGITPEKIREQQKKDITFQGLSIHEDYKIIQKVLEWMYFTLSDGNVIDDTDMELFRDFMLKLIAADDLLRYLKILNLMSTHLQSANTSAGMYGRWCYELESLQNLLDQQSYTRFEFTF